MTTLAAEMTSSGPRTVRAPRGSDISCRGWQQEAALRMLMNNLDPDVAERPEDLVVYGGTGKAARSWEAFDAIVRTLRTLGDDETMLVQSGKPVGVFRTHEMAPRVLISNSMLVPRWATWDTFRELEHAGLTMYGQMTAGSWIYIGTQGILQGTYETFAEAATQRFGGFPGADRASHQDALPRPRERRPRRGAAVGGPGAFGPRGGLDRGRRQLRRGPAGAARARVRAGSGDRPDERARPAGWVRPGRAVARGGRAAAPRRSGRVRAAFVRIHGATPRGDGWLPGR